MSVDNYEYRAKLISCTYYLFLLLLRLKVKSTRDNFNYGAADLFITRIMDKHSNE